MAMDKILIILTCLLLSIFSFGQSGTIVKGTAVLNCLNQADAEKIGHTDNENFDMIIVRKGSKIIRLKVNKLTRMTSVNDLQLVAEKITDSL